MKSTFKSTVKCNLIALSLASALFSGNALGAIVCNTSPLGDALPLAIVKNVEGAYANFATGQFANGGEVSNWDINFYFNDTSLSFWTTSESGAGPNHILIDSNSRAVILAPGQPIGPSQNFSSANITGGFVPTAILNGGTGYVGVHFYNEVLSVMNYGWVALTVEAGSSDGFPATIDAFCYEDSGAEIAAGDDGLSAPELSFDVASLDFESVQLGSSVDLSVTLTNSGDAPGLVESFNIDEPVFAISGGTCATPPFSLDPESSCTLNVSFTPDALGMHEGELALVVPKLRGSSITSVALSGSGIGSSDFGFDVASVDFGGVTTGETSQPQTVTLTNHGNATGSVDVLSVTPSSFEIVGGTCAETPFDLEPEASCTLSLAFTPTSSGAVSGSLTFMIPSRGTIANTSVSLNGVGIDPTYPEIGFTSSSLTFGSTSVGSSSSSQLLTISNSGTASGAASGVIVSSGAGDFAISGGSCNSGGFTLAAGESCTVAITFSPSVIGSINGQVEIVSNMLEVRGGPIVVASLSGTGVPAAPAPIATNVPVNQPWVLAMLLGVFGLIGCLTLRRR